MLEKNKGLEEKILFKEDVLLKNGFEFVRPINEEKSLYAKDLERLVVKKESDQYSSVYDSFIKYSTRDVDYGGKFGVQLDMFETVYK